MNHNAFVLKERKYLIQLGYICLIHLYKFNKSSKFNIGLSECVIVLFYCSNNNEPN